MIPFNKPFIVGDELKYIRQAVELGKLTGNGHFSQLCHRFFKERYPFGKCLLTTSCTDALEMAALLLDIQEGDEVIMPSYTFVSTANAFVLRGARVIFADSRHDNPNLDIEQVESLVTERTKAVVVVHYAGIACDMDPLKALADKHDFAIVEDAAQAVDSFYKGRALGSIGHLAAFSFHETKNIISGEGGMLVVNDPAFEERAEIIWEKGTNRAAFFRGEVDKYNWVDMGSSFLPSELTAAFLYAQLECMDRIQDKRKAIWNTYFEELAPLQEEGHIQLALIPPYAFNNAHMFYVLCSSLDERTRLITHLKDGGFHAVFHYLSLHRSPFYRDKHDGRELPHADRYTDTLLRLPFYFELSTDEVKAIARAVREFYKGPSS